MIFWQGLGIFSILIPMIAYIAVVSLVRSLTDNTYINTHSWPGALGMLLGAALVWLWALKLKKSARLLVDPQTGQTVRLTKKHTFFFIPMEYVAIIAGVLALSMFFVKRGVHH
jgi:hypothetical protein